MNIFVVNIGLLLRGSFGGAEDLKWFHSSVFSLKNGSFGETFGRASPE
jgi:hypothetical protein